MLVGPDFLREGDLPPVVIVGSGPAGITLARSLAARRIGSLLLEAGDDGYVVDIQDDYRGTVEGDPYFDLDFCRLRQFGGSSNHWTGVCRPLDPWDFEPVPELGVPGWPISSSDLDPYAAETREILEVAAPDDQPLSEGVFGAEFVLSPPVNFALKYGPEIEASPLIKLALLSPVTELLARDGRIAGLTVAAADGTRITLSPRIVVLACGGIENSRLLLWSNEVSPQRVVTDTGALGRYWMEHPHEDVGAAMLRRPVYSHPRGEDPLQSVGLAPGRLREFGALNAAVRFGHFEGGDLRLRVKRGLCSLTPETVEAVNAVAGTNASCEMQSIKVVWEQAPAAENRVALSETERDRLGLPRTRLHWRKSPLDYHTAKVAFELAGRHVVSSGTGLVRAERFLIEMEGYPGTGEIAGNHHMGGTRMSDTPREGVVDRDLRLHGIANGYVAGSSVFVRSGHANPTYTIVQLSLRLADHLARVLDT